jgi:hypothetical protein
MGLAGNWNWYGTSEAGRVLGEASRYVDPEWPTGLHLAVLSGSEWLLGLLDLGLLICD